MGKKKNEETKALTKDQKKTDDDLVDKHKKII